MSTAIASLRTSLRAAPGLIELPIPPLSLPTAENAYRVGEAVLLTLKDGRRVRGVLLSFRPNRGRLFLRRESQTDVDSEEFSFIDIRTLQVLGDRKIVRLSPTLEIRGKVVLPPTRQDFEILLDNGETLTGETFGFRIDLNGLHLYPANENEAGRYTHLFIASHAIKMQRVGPLLGEALVEQQLVTYEALADELAAQHKRRIQPIGEYLVSAKLVTPKELEAALERQRATPEMRLGEILVSEGLITEDQLGDALREQEKNRKMPLGEMLIASGILTVDSITQALAQKLGLPFVDLHEFSIDTNAVKLLDKEIARKQQVIPLYVEDDRMVIAVENPMQWRLVEALKVFVKMDVELVMATAADIAWAIDEYYD